VGTAAALFFLQFWHRRGKIGSRWWAVGMWCFLGLAFLTKGPVGLLPLCSFIVFLTVLRQFRRLKELAHPLGIALFVMIGLGWYIFIVARDPSLLR